MKAQIRLAESGHSYHYSELTTVHSLMQQIRKDFKIEMEDQKIIMKSGEILKSTTTFQSVQQKMKKTIPTANSALINEPSFADKQVTEIQCLYVYNQKQLLKPIEIKNFTEDFYLKILNQKCRQMSPLAQNSYQYKQFCQKISQKNINGTLELINKRLKNPLQTLVPRYNRSLNNLNQRNYSKLQIFAFLDLIQNQEKARKLLIRNIEYILQSQIKKKLVSIAQRIEKQGVHENQILLKQNSGFFSSSKQNNVSQSLNELNNCRKQIQQKLNAFIAKYKKEKKSIINKQFLEEEKITYNVDKNITILEKEYDESIKFVKDHYEEFCEELIRINALLSKGKQKDIKQLSKNLFLVNDKISSFQSKIQDHISKFSCMYVQLSKIHTKGQTQSIKIVFATYIQLTKGLNQIDQDIIKLQKQFSTYKQAKAREIQVSQFNQSKNNIFPLKKVILSPKKQEKQNNINSRSSKAGNSENNNQKVEVLQSQINEQNSISKQKQCNFPKINSPIKNKMDKSSKKALDDEIEPRQLKSAFLQNKQLIRRLHFNRRLQGLQNYCLNLCQKQQDQRRNFRNSKIFEQNKIDLLGKLNVPTIQVDYTQTSDTELAHIYKRLAHQGKVNTQASQISWQNELVQTTNCVYKTLTTYLASKSNATQREKNIEKMLGLLSQTFYKMMKAKVDRQTQSIKASTREQIQQVYYEKISLLQKQNQQLCQKLKRVNKNLQGKSLQSNQSSKFVQNLERFQQIENKYQELAGANQQLEDQNKNLNEQIKNMQEKLLEYQEEMDQITQKLINSSQQQSNPDQIQQTQQLRQRLKVQNQTNAVLGKQVKDLKTQLQKAKKNLVRQVEACQTLYKQIQEISGQKQFYEREFSELKNMLADRQIIIIKLERQIQETKKSSESNKMSYSQQNEENHACQCTQQLILLRQQKQGLHDIRRHIRRFHPELCDAKLKQIRSKSVSKQTWQSQCQQSMRKCKVLNKSKIGFVKIQVEEKIEKRELKLDKQQKQLTNLQMKQNNFILTEKYEKQARFIGKNIAAVNNLVYNSKSQSEFIILNSAFGVHMGKRNKPTNCIKYGHSVRSDKLKQHRYKSFPAACTV